jgi:anti-repressor protein
MNNNLAVFNSDEFGEVRVAEIDGQSYFALKDVLSAQGTSTSTNQAISAINKGLGKGYIKVIPLETSGGIQDTKFVAEPAVTFLVSRSNTERGRRCNRWIHSEILPSIRKHGAYMTDSVIDQVMSNPAIVYKMAETMLHERKLREIAEAKIKEDEPKVRRTEAVIGSPDSVTIGTMATILKQNGIDIGQNRLYKILRKNGFLLSQHDRYNHPAQTWLNKGLFQLEEILVHHNNKTIGVRYRTRVTGKGQVFLVDYISNLLDSAI